MTAGLGGFTVRWSTAERGVRYKVTVTDDYRRNGRMVWGTAKVWKASTTATSATYTGTPLRLKRGRSYKIVKATDALGNTRTTTRTTRIPA